MENSRFGCPDCYGVFDLLINDKMKQLQGSENHKGKQPKFKSRFEREHGNGKMAGAADGTETMSAAGDLPDPESPEEQILALDARLKEAIRQEEYELAARYRDEIRALKERKEEHE